MKLSDMEMPKKESEASEEEEFDFGFGEEAPEEESATDLSALSDEDLIKEMEKRGFEVSDEMEEAPSEEMPEEEMEL